MIRTDFARLMRRALCTLALLPISSAAAQMMSLDTRDPSQKQDASFEKAYSEWIMSPKHGSPLVDHLPVVAGIPMPKDIIGYHVGAPRKLTYYADQLKYYRALAAASPRVMVESIGRSDEGRELVVIWISSDANMANMAQNRANLKKIADPRGMSEAQVKDIIKQTKPHYHFMGGLHSGETGPSEMLMELAYRLAVETSPIISGIRDNLYVSITPVADADGRDRNVDWFYRGLEAADSAAAEAAREGDAADADSASGDSTSRGRATRGSGRGIGSVPYWGKYAYHDNNRDINLVLDQMRAIADWYFTAHPPIMHDLHESLALLYTYSGGAPQNPNLDPLLFAELPWFANWEMAQMTKWGMPGVYTHAFMDGWSPGYLGSIAYNHNGLMKMYETQSGRDLDSAAVARARKPQVGPTRTTAGGGFGGGGGAVPTGRGGGQDREWYRGIQVGFNDVATFTRRANANYMQTGVLSALQLASMFPATILENFYVKTRNSMMHGLTEAPYAYVIPVQRDMTKPAEMVKILRFQRVEVGIARDAIKVNDSTTYPAGSYVIKLDQPYGRLAKNLLEKQNYPDPRLRTYDDSGWSMGFAMGVDVFAVADSSILKAPVTMVDEVTLAGNTKGNGTAALAVAHLGSNNMISLRYKLKDVPMRVTEKSFSAEGVEFPAGSFVITDMTAADRVRAAVAELGLTAAALSAAPTVATHDAVPPRVAIYTQWSGTQSLGWYRLTFDKFGVPFDLIYKERVMEGKLRDQYDVILMAEQNMSRATVMAPKAANPTPYKKSEKYQFLGDYGETDDMSGGFGQKGVDAFEAFLEAGGTLITVGEASRLPIEFGWAGTVDKTAVPGLTAQRPLIEGEIVKTDHPVFYGFGRKTIPVKYVGGTPFEVGIANRGNVLARYVGGDDAVLSGLMVNADSLKGRPFAVDIPEAFKGKGRVIMFSNNPIYRWQNHGEFNMIFNAVINWNAQPTLVQ